MASCGGKCGDSRGTCPLRPALGSRARLCPRYAGADAATSLSASGGQKGRPLGQAGGTRPWSNGNRMATTKLASHRPIGGSRPARKLAVGTKKSAKVSATTQPQRANASTLNHAVDNPPEAAARRLGPAGSGLGNAAGRPLYCMGVASRTRCAGNGLSWQSQRLCGPLAGILAQRRAVQVRSLAHRVWGTGAE